MITKIPSEIRSAFFDNAHTPFVILDEELNFCEINNAALTTLQITKKDVMGMNLISVLPYVKDTDRHRAYLEVIRTGETIEIDNIRMDVNSQPFLFSIRAFKVGNYLCIAGINKQTLINMGNELKFAQYELELAYKDLKNRNEELEELSYVSAHDLKAHLTNLHTLLQMLGNEAVFDEEIEPIYSKVMHVAELMSSKLRALNEVIAIRGHLGENKQIILFEEILNNIKSETSEEITKTGTIIYTDFEPCPKIYFDPLQMHSLLHNLINNAIKYRHPERAPEIIISSKTVGTKTMITVKDNGLGFDNTIEKNKFFGLFKRMHTHVDGLGVGLYMVKSMVQSQGGYIDVDSKLNIGTTFKLVV